MADKGVTMANDRNPLIYSCAACSSNQDSRFKPTGKYQSLADHFEKCHGGDDTSKDVLQCTECQESFATPEAIKEHVATRHEREFRPARCYKCKLGFRSSYAGRY